MIRGQPTSVFGLQLQLRVRLNPLRSWLNPNLNLKRVVIQLEPGLQITFKVGTHLAVISEAESRTVRFSWIMANNDYKSTIRTRTDQ